MNPQETQLLVGIISVIGSLAVGFGGALLGNRFAKKRADDDKATTRRQVLVAYEKALMDRSWYIESTRGYGSGAHAKPESDAIEKARANAFPYLFELENHKQYFSLRSPYFEAMGGDERSDESDFLAAAYQAIENHLKDYPKPLAKSPYTKAP